MRGARRSARSLWGLGWSRRPGGGAGWAGLELHWRCRTDRREGPDVWAGSGDVLRCRRVGSGHSVASPVDSTL